MRVADDQLDRTIHECSCVEYETTRDLVADVRQLREAAAQALGALVAIAPQLDDRPIERAPSSEGVELVIKRLIEALS